MSDYFADKDGDQSFDMPNDDPSSPSSSMPGGSVPPGAGGADDSGFNYGGNTPPTPQQDFVYMGIMAVIVAVMVYILYAMFFASSGDQSEKIEPVAVEAPAKVQPQPQPQPQPKTISKPIQQPTIHHPFSSHSVRVSVRSNLIKVKASLKTKVKSMLSSKKTAFCRLQ